MVCDNRKTSEIFLFCLMTACVLGGVGLSLSSLIVPNWAHKEFAVGIVLVKADVGMVQTRQCDYQGCHTYWFMTRDYDRYPESKIESQHVIRSLISAGMSSGFTALCLLVFLWFSKHLQCYMRIIAQAAFFLFSLGSGSAHIGWAPILAGCAGGLMFFAALLSGLYCRCNIPRKQLAQATKQRKNTPLDKAYIVNHDFNACVGGEEKKQPL